MSKVSDHSKTYYLKHALPFMKTGLSIGFLSFVLYFMSNVNNCTPAVLFGSLNKP